MSTLVKNGVAICVLVGVFALTWFVYYPHSPLGKQEKNLSLAGKHQLQVEADLRQMAGAGKVRVSVYTGLGGSLSVSGDVSDEQTAEGVIRVVLASSPPVTVRFSFTVGKTNSIHKVVECRKGDAANSHPTRHEQ